MNFQISRKDELQLIKLGLNQLMKSLSPVKRSYTKKDKNSKSKRKWSREQHRKFAQSMSKVWKEKKNKEKE